MGFSITILYRGHGMDVIILTILGCQYNSLEEESSQKIIKTST